MAGLWGWATEDGWEAVGLLRRWSRGSSSPRHSILGRKGRSWGSPELPGTCHALPPRPSGGGDELGDPRETEAAAAARRGRRGRPRGRSARLLLSAPPRRPRPRPSPPRAPGCGAAADTERPPPGGGCAARTHAGGARAAPEGARRWRRRRGARASCGAGPDGGRRGLGGRPRGSAALRAPPARGVRGVRPRPRRLPARGARRGARTALRPGRGGKGAAAGAPAPRSPEPLPSPPASLPSRASSPRRTPSPSFPAFSPAWDQCARLPRKHRAVVCCQEAFRLCQLLPFAEAGDLQPGASPVL